MSAVGTRRTKPALRDRPAYMQRLFPSKKKIALSKRPIASTIHSNFFSNIELDKMPEDDGEMFDQAVRKVKNSTHIINRPFQSEPRSDTQLSDTKRAVISSL